MDVAGAPRPDYGGTRDGDHQEIAIIGTERGAIMRIFAAVIALALVVLLPNSSPGMAIFGPSKDAASDQDSWDWRHERAGTGARVSPLPASRPADCDWEAAFAAQTGGAAKADGAAKTEGSPNVPTAGRVWRLPEPATLAIWSSLGLFLGLRVWQRRRREMAWDTGEDLPPLASHRRTWSSQQRLAIRRTIERGCRQELGTGGL